MSADGEMSPHVPSSRFLRIPIHDNGKADIVPYFEKAFAFLGEPRFLLVSNHLSDTRFTFLVMSISVGSFNNAAQFDIGF